MIRIDKAETGDLPLIHQLAHLIWPQTYSSILSKDQLDFMLEKSYAVEALNEAAGMGTQFYILYFEELPSGFISLEKQNDVVRIGKLYLSTALQGKGLGKKLIDFAVSYANQHNIDTLELNVNRANKAYYFYLKQGFQVLKTIDIPYYGFVLNDFVMQKKLNT